jgi:hypothetical protein
VLACLLATSGVACGGLDASGLGGDDPDARDFDSSASDALALDSSIDATNETADGSLDAESDAVDDTLGDDTSTDAPPADTSPGDTTPADTAPADTTPADTGPLYCSVLTNPKNGKVAPTTAVTGGLATYACDPGYSLTGNGGSATRSCQSDGSWSGTAPACVANSCAPNLTAPANGMVSRTSGVTGDIATYGCSGGYTLTGNATRVCQTDGTWSGIDAVCSATSTGCTPNPCLHSAAGCVTVGTTGHSCGVCVAGWTGTNCDVPVTCTGGVAPANGTVSAASAAFGSSITYGCNGGYTLSGTATATCRSDGTFSSPAPSCAPSACAPNLAAPANGNVTPSAGTTGTVATYGCDAGYALSGNASRTCQASGAWSGSDPTCALVTTGCTPDPCVHSAAGCVPVGASGYSCGTCVAGWSGANCDLPVSCSGATAPANGAVSAASATFGNTVNYSCHVGFTLSGAATATCQASGSFTGPAPTCAPVDCGAPPTVVAAPAPIVTGGAGGGTSDTFGATAAYVCFAGYVENGANPTCGAGGTWGAAPTCTPVNCGAPPAVANAGAPTVSGGAGGGSSTTLAAAAVYACDAGYSVMGANSICGLGGVWSAAPSCAPIDCGPPPAVTHAGAPTVGGGAGGGVTDTFGATASYACDAGYAKSGSNPVCAATGVWGAAPSCAPVDCGAPPTVANAGIPTVSGGLGGGNSSTYGATAAYACNSGYLATGSNPLCGAGGAWGAAPSCAPVDCGVPPVVAHAGTPTVSGGAGGGATDTFGATAAYTCNSGYAKSGANPACAASGSWGPAPTCTLISCGVYTDVVYRTTGTFAITNTAFGAGDQTFNGLTANASTPSFTGSGDTTPFSRPPASGGATFTAGFARLRFTNDASGNPIAGTVRLIEWYVPLEFNQTAGANITYNLDHSVGLLFPGPGNCGGGDGACSNHTPSVQRNCTANAQGTLSGTSLTWASCTPVPTMTNAWSFSNARAATGAGCAAGYNSWGTVKCNSSCGFVAPANLGDAYQTWNQTLQPFAFNGTNIKTSTFTMPAMQVPTGGNQSTTLLSITSSTILGTQCGSTPGTDLICNVQ